MEAQLLSWRPTSATAGRFTGSPSYATSSLDTQRGQCGAIAGWAVRVKLGPSPLAQPFPTSIPLQLRLYRVCFSERCAGCRGAG